MTALDWVLIAATAAWLTVAVLYLVRKKGSGCCGSCAGNCDACRKSRGATETDQKEKK